MKQVSLLSTSGALQNTSMNFNQHTCSHNKRKEKYEQNSWDLERPVFADKLGAYSLGGAWSGGISYIWGVISSYEA